MSALDNFKRPRGDAYALAKNYLDTVARVTSSDVERLAKLIAQVEYEAKLDAICILAQEADEAALEQPQNRFKDNPRAAFQSGACRAAWRIRQVKPDPQTGGTP